MTQSPAQMSTDTTVSGVSDLIEALGLEPGEKIPVRFESKDGQRQGARIVYAKDAPQHIAENHEGFHTWLGINPTSAGLDEPRKGRADEITRITALYADLDAKPSGLHTFEKCWNVIAELSAIIGTGQTVTIMSGGGLQPIWPIEDCDDVGAGRKLLARWGRLVGAIAKAHNGNTDSVYNADRILRAPGTQNLKGDVPIDTALIPGDGGPVTVERILEVLDEYNIEELPTDGQAIGEIAAPEDNWASWREETCKYAATAIVAWIDPSPSAKWAQRHPDYLNRLVRLECFRRVGCLTERDYVQAQADLELKFVRALSDQYPQRRPGKYEVASMKSYAVGIACRKQEGRDLMTEIGPADGTGHKPCCGQDGSQAPTTQAAQENSPAGHTAPGRPRLRRASDLKGVERPAWLAKNRIPRRAATILVGDEGIGKSLFWVYIAAAVTTGSEVKELGIPARDPAHIFLILTEDDWTTEVRPRLEAAGADLDYISVLSTEDDGSGSPVFPDDMSQITEADVKPALVVVDAWLDTVPGNLRVRDAQQSREALHPWKEAAAATGAAILLMTHTNRLETGDIRNKYGATASLRQKARATLFALEDPERPREVIVGPDKANTTAGGVTATRFRRASVQMWEADSDHDGTVGALELIGDTGRTIKEHLADVIDAAKDGRKSEVAEWLEEYLGRTPKDPFGHAAADVLKAGKDEEGYSDQQLKRAKRKLKVHAVGKPDPDGTQRWYWHLPDTTSKE